MISVLNQNNYKIFYDYVAENINVYTIKMFTKYAMNTQGQTHDIWLQFEDEKIVSLISLSGGAGVVYKTPQSNDEEIHEFFKMAKFDEILISKDYNFKNENDTEKIGFIMKYNKGNDNLKLSNEFKAEKDNFKTAHNILKKCESKDFIVVDYLDFLNDMTNKSKLNCGQTVVLYNDNTPIATASVVFKCKFGAVVGSIAVLKEYRHLGAGQAVVNYMKKILLDENIENIFIQCNTDYNKAFYQKLSFDYVGDFKIISSGE